MKIYIVRDDEGGFRDAFLREVDARNYKEDVCRYGDVDEWVVRESYERPRTWHVTIELSGRAFARRNDMDHAEKAWLVYGTVKRYGGQWCAWVHADDEAEAIARARELAVAQITEKP